MHHSHDRFDLCHKTFLQNFIDMSLQTLASGMKQCEDFMLFQVSRGKYLVFALYLVGNVFGEIFFALL